MEWIEREKTETSKANWYNTKRNKMKVKQSCGSIKYDEETTWTVTGKQYNLQRKPDLIYTHLCGGVVCV